MTTITREHLELAALAAGRRGPADAGGRAEARGMSAQMGEM